MPPLPSPRRAAAPPSARAAALSLVLLVAGAAPAEAQLLGRVKRAAQDRVAQAIGGDRAADDARSGGTTRAPAPITAERLDAFLTAMAPAVAQAERGRTHFAARQAYETASREYDARTKTWNACGERIMAAAGPPTVQQQLRMAELSTRLQPLTERFLAEAQHGYGPRAVALEDSIRVEQMRVTLAVYPRLRDCGDAPRRPAAPPTQEAAVPEQLIVPPAGMTRAQFGRLRERVAVYALTRGAQDPFTAEERAVLDARAAALDALAPLFRDGMLEWATWNAESNLGQRWRAVSEAAPPGPASTPR